MKLEHLENNVVLIVLRGAIKKQRLPSSWSQNLLCIL